MLRDGAAVLRARDLVHELLAQPHAHLPDAAGGDADDHAGRLTEQILRSDLRARLLRVEKPGERIDRAGEHGAGRDADPRRRQRRQAVVGRNRARAAERGDEDAHDAAAEESRPSVIELVIESAVEVLEDFSEEERKDQEQEPDGSDGKDDGERAEREQLVHLGVRCPHSREASVACQIRWKFFSISRRERRSTTGRPCGHTLEYAVRRSSSRM